MKKHFALLAVAVMAPVVFHSAALADAAADLEALKRVANAKKQTADQLLAEYNAISASGDVDVIMANMPLADAMTQAGIESANAMAAVEKAEKALAASNPAGQTDAAAQLLSVNAHSTAASSSSDKFEAGRGIDDVGKNGGSLPVVESSAPYPAPAFVTRLPDAAQSDAQVQQSVAYFRKLDGLKAETAGRIEALKKEQQSGTGDKAILAARLGTLTNDLQRHESDQAQAKESVKKRVKDLGFDWNE